VDALYRSSAEVQPPPHLAAEPARGADDLPKKCQRKRVVITGMGVLTPFGDTIEAFRDALFAKQSAIKPSERFLPIFENANAAEVLAPLRLDELPAELQNKLDKSALWAYKVARDAMAQAGLQGDKESLDSGLIIGVSSSGTEAYIPLIENRLEEFSLEKSKLSGSFSSACSVVSSLLGLGGGFELVATACTASTNAIGIGFDRIQNNKSPFILAVGSEPLYLPTFAGFFGLKAMRVEPCTPFSGTPGMSLGEGAGAIVLEEYEHAKARGATIFGEIVSYATSGDAYHETAPDPRADGVARAMRLAMFNAGIEPDKIDYINAHGTGTEVNDRAETLAIKKVFSDFPELAVSTTKAYFGHNIGAAGIIEFLACLVTLPEGKLLPTLNFSKPRAGCDLNYIPNEFMDKDVGLFMKNNYAFGGNNCSIVASTKTGFAAPTAYQPRTVVITGVGAVSSAGIGRAEMFDNICSGGVFSTKGGLVSAELGEEQRQALKEHFVRNPQLAEILSRLPIDAKGHVTLPGYGIDNEKLKKHLRHANDRKARKISMLALLALDLALIDANRKIRRDGQDMALILGMSKGPHSAVARFTGSLYPDPKYVRTLDFPGSLMNAVATYCSIAKSIGGYNTTLATGFNAGLGALSYGYELVRQGVQPQAIIGGADENFIGSSSALLSHSSDQLNYSFAEDAFQVYGYEHSGFHMGEGACMAMLEDEAIAHERGARILGRVLGYGVSNDINYFADEDAQAAAVMMVRAIHQALTEAALTPDDIDLICGSSWGSKGSSLKELDAIGQVFGRRAALIPLLNHNGHFGFVESSAALLNLAMVLMSAEKGQLLPIAHTRRFCRSGFDFVSNVRTYRFSTVLLLGATEGGGNYAFVIRVGAQ